MEGIFFVFIFRRLLREDPLGAVRALHTPSLASIVRPRRLQRLKRRLSRKQGLPNLTTGRGVRRQQLILGCWLQPLLVEVLLAAQRMQQLTILLPPRGVTRRLERRGRPEPLGLHRPCRQTRDLEAALGGSQRMVVNMMRGQGSRRIQAGTGLGRRRAAAAQTELLGRGRQFVGR